MPPRKKSGKKKKRKKNKRKSVSPNGPNETADPSPKRNTATPKAPEELAFEDSFADEIEEEDIVNPAGGDHDMDETASEKPQPQHKDVWMPGMGLEEGQELEYDSSAYTTFHRLNVEWPALSFDILQDKLGQFRSKYPATMYFCAGTQAEGDSSNSLSVYKVSDIHKTEHDEDSDDDDPDNLDDDPIVQIRRCPHDGVVNRVRSMPQQANIVATFSDRARVHIYDLKHELSALDRPPSTTLPESRPVFTWDGHPEEGYGLAWSPTTVGRLLSADCRKNIYLWEPQQGGSWAINKGTPFTGHKDSVEDLQWSPNEPNVFASCSVDRTLCIWDARARNRPQLQIAIHDDDVNVISWNRRQTHLLASGCDDGSFKVWDFRNISSKTPAANFTYHKAPITSIEWHPTDDSVLLASSADNQTSFWDMSLEADPDAQAQGARLQAEIPPQLLFIHMQTEVKEAHFHPQIPGVCIATGYTGFNIYRPQNL